MSEPADVMAGSIDLLAALDDELRQKIVPSSAFELSERLERLSIGVNHHCPIFYRDARMFRIRQMSRKPTLLIEVGEPPSQLSRIGRLNDQGQSVLYLADSPETAFAERGATAGDYCLSEWRVTAEKFALANGGIPPRILAERFPNEEGSAAALNSKFPPRHDANEILKLFADIYTLDVGGELLLYRWSIACGMVNGFSHKCDRNSATEVAGSLTRWTGRHPFGAIAYPSVRTDRKSLNYAFNDHGRSQLKIDHVQWVRRFDDGSYASLDFANEFDDKGVIHWQNRPAMFQLKPGERARVIKTAETAWRYETEDGTIPWFA
ncbi:MAG TPA: RES family NAD+ phosphorylase [Chthoniobacterales bacterium]|nr:RES family NAD+ phosphorylase [Chthoniobacterales bacterium]